MAEILERVSFDIPDDVQFEILKRLPVDSLLRFKSVCKSWYAFLKTRHFIEKHQKESTLNTHPLLVQESLDHPINLHFPESRYYSIVGVCCGLVLWHNRSSKKFIVANPMTRQFRRFSWPFKLYYYENDELFFGFGVLGNSQHIVRVICSSYPNGNFDAKAEIFVMDADTSIDMWKIIDVRIGEGGALLAGKVLRWAYELKLGRQVVINGIFYWEAYMSRDACVVSFDINKSLFDIITTPFDASLVRWKLGEMKGELSLILYHGDRWFELFVLNENKRSWSVKYEISNIPMCACCSDHERGRVSVLGCIRNDKLVLEDRFENHTCLLFLNLSTGEIRTPFCSEDGRFEFYLSSESLALVNNKDDAAEYD